MRKALLLFAIVAAALLVFYAGPIAPEAKLAAPTSAPVNLPKAVGLAPAPLAVATIVPHSRVPTTSTPAEPAMRQHVFRLQLEGNRCTLEAQEEVSGAFGRERTVRWAPGMLCCRLRAEDGRIVGERTLPAPDQVCVVLDPNDPSGTPTAARLTSEGPVVFQVRFADLAGAVRLEVARITAAVRPEDSAAPIGTLLASIPIPQK